MTTREKSLQQYLDRTLQELIDNFGCSDDKSFFIVCAANDSGSVSVSGLGGAAGLALYAMARLIARLIKVTGYDRDEVLEDFGNAVTVALDDASDGRVQ